MNTIFIYIVNHKTDFLDYTLSTSLKTHSTIAKIYNFIFTAAQGKISYRLYYILYSAYFPYN